MGPEAEWRRHLLGGSVLKLSNGKTYSSKAELQANGSKLQVSGCLGPICKHQTWTRDN